MSHGSSVSQLGSSVQVYSLRPKSLLPEAKAETRTFQTSIAKKYGPNAAIVFQQLNFRLCQPTRIIDGVPWYAASYATWRAWDFPFWSEKTIERAFKKLVKANLVRTRRVNQRRYDQTLWYTIDEGQLRALRAEWAETHTAVQVDKMSASRRTPCPVDEPDNVSGSVEEEREKKEPDFSLLPSEEAASPPPPPEATPAAPESTPCAAHQHIWTRWGLGIIACKVRGCDVHNQAVCHCPHCAASEVQPAGAVAD